MGSGQPDGGGEVWAARMVAMALLGEWWRTPGGWDHRIGGGGKQWRWMVWGRGGEEQKKTGLAGRRGLRPNLIGRGLSA